MRVITGKSVTQRIVRCRRSCRGASGFPSSLPFLLCHPLICTGFEQVERQGAAVEDLVVEGADVELGSKFFFRAVTKLTDLELAQLVAERLRGPRDVAVGLSLDGGLVDGAGLAHEVHH